MYKRSLAEQIENGVVYALGLFCVYMMLRIFFDGGV